MSISPHFLSSLWANILAAKKYKQCMFKKSARQTFVPKRRAYNVGEIDHRMTFLNFIPTDLITTERQWRCGEWQQQQRRGSRRFQSALHRPQESRRRVDGRGQAEDLLRCHQGLAHRWQGDFKLVFRRDLENPEDKNGNCITSNNTWHLMGLRLFSTFWISVFKVCFLEVIGFVS